MNLRLVRDSDVNAIFDLFKNSQITAMDVRTNESISSGFYEYPLAYEDIKERATASLSLLAQDS